MSSMSGWVSCHVRSWQCAEITNSKSKLIRTGRGRLNHVPLLFDESATVLGLKVLGSPMTVLYGGAFGRSSEADRERVYDRIPVDTDIIITHGPPQDVLDCGQGCAALRRAVCIELRTRCLSMQSCSTRTEPAVISGSFWNWMSNRRSPR